MLACLFYIDSPAETRGIVITLSSHAHAVCQHAISRRAETVYILQKLDFTHINVMLRLWRPLNHVLGHCFYNVCPLHGNDLHIYDTSGAQRPLAGIDARWDTALKAGRVMQRLSGSLSSVGSGDTSLCDIKLCSSLWCVGVKWPRHVICQPHRNTDCDDYNIGLVPTSGPGTSWKLMKVVTAPQANSRSSGCCCYWAITWFAGWMSPTACRCRSISWNVN